MPINEYDLNVDSSGRCNLHGYRILAPLHVEASLATDPGLIVQLASSHSANGIELRDSDGATIWSVSAAGVEPDVVTDAGTNTVIYPATFDHESSGTPTTGFGVGVKFLAESNTTANTVQGIIHTQWSTATHASRKALMILTAYDTAAREGLRILADGSYATLGIGGANLASTQLYILSPTATYTPLYLKGASSQSGNYLTIVDSADGAIASITSAGALTVKGAATCAGVTSSAAMAGTVTDAGTTTVVYPVTADHESSGTPGTNFGAGIKFTAESTTTAAQDAGVIDVYWADATHATRTSKMTVKLVNSAAALAEAMSVTAAGALTAIGSVTSAGVSSSAAMSGTITDTATNTVVYPVVVDHETSGTPTTNFGSGIQFNGESTTTAAQQIGAINAAWTTATHASRIGYLSLSAVDSTAVREGFRVSSDGYFGNCGIGGATSTSTSLMITVPDAAHCGIDMKLAGSATGNAIRVQTSAGADIMSLGPSGTLTVANGLTVTAGGATVTAGGLTVTAGGATITAGGLTVTAGGLTVTAGDVLINGAADNVGINVGSPTHKLEVKQYSTRAASSYTQGSGLDDCTSGGTYIGAADATFTVYVDTAAGTDKFSWKKDAGSPTTGVSMTGSAQTLQDGVTVTFGATTGHDITATGAVVFTGTGLNDGTSGGTYTDTDGGVFLVVVEHAAGTDKFKWNKDGGAWTEDVDMTGAAQTLSDGVTITFGATTGHTEGDQWSITCTVADTWTIACTAVPAVNIQDAAGNTMLKLAGTKQTALTSQLTTITHTAPSSPDYAIQDLVNSSAYGFVTKDEGNSVLAVIANLQTRLAELEDRLGHTAGVGLLNH